MKSGKVNIWHSLVTRFGLFFIGLIILAIFVSGFLIYRRASDIIATFSKERIAHSSKLAEQAFFALLTEVENDISVMAENPNILKYAEQPSIELRNDIENLFHINLKNKPNYFQVRLISILENGQEVIRLDKIGKNISRTVEKNLQNKSQRPYYKEALGLKPNEFYFSPISLNEEFGIVSPSLTPTIRAISLIYNEKEQPVYMVVINLNLKNFYQGLRSIMTSGIELMLLDEDGQYLFASDMTKCFSKQLKSFERFDADFRVPFEQLKTDSTRFENLVSKKDNSFLSQISALNYSHRKNQIYLLSFLKEDIAFSSVLFIKQYSYKILPIITLVALIIAILFIRILAQRIGSITEVIGNYEHTTTAEFELSKNRNDELGVLARTFSKMKERISKQVDDLQVSLYKEQKAIQEKDEFLQNMSHELRTPLNSILGLTQLLKKNKPNPEITPIVDAIDRSAQSLAGLMYDVLDHQKLIEGQVHLKLETENFAEILTDIHASYRFEAINKGLQFDLIIDPTLKSKWYKTDPLRFSQIVTNLVINAIKFTAKGSVKLEAEIENTGELKISVSDTGKGILPENLDKIRNRFFQENQSVSGDGYGLGLSIVKQLVDLFNGQLEVESQQNEGSVFSIRFPLEEVTEQISSRSKEKKAISFSDFSQLKTILHIEDDNSARLLINQYLRSPKINLIQTNNLSYAKQVIEKEKPDLVISDLMLESIDIGNELNSVIPNQTPLIILSAKEESYLKNLSSNYLQKPFDLDDLLDLIIVLLEKEEYDVPNLAVSYQQYDYENQKVIKFLNILISEFETYLDRFESAYETKDETEWEAIRHKLITHIKSLELNKLKELLPMKVEDMDESIFHTSKKMLCYYLSYFRNELRSF